MTIPTSIPKKLPENSALSYRFLREEGIRHIQQLAGHIWTDYNSHDPGITILEQLCYAITDLSYRIQSSMPDLLGRDDAELFQSLFTPAQILTVSPVTLLDIRKVVLDVSGVQNAWVEKVSKTKPELFFDNNDEKLHLESSQTSLPVSLKGLYQVVIEKQESSTEQYIHERVKSRLQASRGLCEDFVKVKLLGSQYITLHGSVEVGQVDDIHQLIAKILLRISELFSPKNTFYTLQQLLEKGRKMDEIFDGPILDHGFLDDEELEQSSRYTEVHTSDLIKAVMDEDGVLTINEVAISYGTSKKEEWILYLDESKVPRLDVMGTLNHLQFVKSGVLVNIDKERVNNLYGQMRHMNQQEVPSENELDILPDETSGSQLDEYYSIQEHFPENYGIGTVGISPTVPPLRKAQSKQLKGYLMFFEQLLANYFAQLDHFKDLVSFGAVDHKTYFNQSLIKDIPELGDVLVGKDSYQDYLEEMVEDSEHSLKRKNAFLNHLLARFSESFTDYAMILQKTEQVWDINTQKQLIQDKIAFLKDYPELSSARGRAFDYTMNGSISGLEKRIAAKIGVNTVHAEESSEEDFYMIEHILLRPAEGDTHLFYDYSTVGRIMAFEASDREGWTKCIAPDHPLLVGELIELAHSDVYEGIFPVDAVQPNSFEIEVPFMESELHSNTSWTRASSRLDHLILNNPIRMLAEGRQSGFTRCETNDTRGLEDGEVIEVVGTLDYDGVYAVSNVTEKSFEIEQPFNQNEAMGRWRSAQGIKDPFSLQLTFVIPEWLEKYQEDNVRKFVERSIREETPAHLGVYIHWWNKQEMGQLRSSYSQFQERLRSK